MHRQVLEADNIVAGEKVEGGRRGRLSCHFRLLLGTEKNESRLLRKKEIIIQPEPGKIFY